NSAGTGGIRGTRRRTDAPGAAALPDRQTTELRRDGTQPVHGNADPGRADAGRAEDSECERLEAPAAFDGVFRGAGTAPLVERAGRRGFGTDDAGVQQPPDHRSDPA